MKHCKIVGGKVHLNPKDKIVMDVPLFIRALEYSKEDARNDMSLHKFTEKALNQQKKHKTLTMKQYNKLVGK